MWLAAEADEALSAESIEVAIGEDEEALAEALPITGVEAALVEIKELETTDEDAL